MTHLLTRPDPVSKVPLFRQLADQVRHAVRTGALRPGDSLPSAGPLATDLAVSPAAVTRAYRSLEREGVIVGARDFAAAIDVQRRLLPQDCPAIAGLDYAGAYRPALGVGGDYYDFIRLSDSEVGIAVGDVCGKGTPAALLMATLRAYLRGQALGRSADLAAVVANLNRLVYECSPANRYATFFYGEYDATSRSLAYVNAGHLPPLVARGGAILRLECTGPVVGLMLESSYEARRITLERGDVLVAFTDGVSEAMNAVGDEWGDAGVTSAVAARGDCPARLLVDRIVGAADAFVDGAPQYDDITVVALRVL